MISLEVYQLCNEGRWDECGRLIDSSANDQLAQILGTHLEIKRKRHSKVRDTCEKIYKKSENPINKFGVIVALLSIYWKYKELESFDDLINEGENLIPDLNEHLNHDWINWFYTMKGVYYWFKGELIDAMVAHKKAEQISHVHADNIGIARSLNNQGLINLYRGDYKGAEHFFSEIINLLNNDNLKYEEDMLKEQAETNLAIVYIDTQKYSDGIKILDKLIEKYSSTSQYDKLALFHYNKSTSLYYLFSNEEARQEAECSIALARKNNNKRILVANYTLQGNINLREGKFYSAEKFFETALQMATELQDAKQIILNKVNVGNINIVRGRLKDAKKHLEAVLSLIETEGKITDSNLITSTNYNLGYIARLENKMNIAEKYWIKVLELRREYYYEEDLANILISLILFYEEQDNQPVVIQYLNELRELALQTEHQLVQRGLSFSEAVFIKKSNREKAIEILKEFLTPDVGFRELYMFNITLLALFTLGELYVEKLYYGELDSLEILRKIINRLINLAEEQKLIPQLIDAMILDSKIKLLNFELIDASQTLDKSLVLAEEYQLEGIKAEVEYEIESIAIGNSKWLKLQAANAGFAKRIEYSRILIFLQNRGSSRGSLPNF